jgi:transposase
VVSAFLTAGNITDITVANKLYDNVHDCFVVEDKGYDSDSHRKFLKSQNNIPVIPGRNSRKTKIMYDKEIYKYRKNIEIIFGKAKENKRIATRFDKSDVTFMSFIAMVFIKKLI